MDTFIALAGGTALVVLLRLGIDWLERRLSGTVWGRPLTVSALLAAIRRRWLPLI